MTVDVLITNGKIVTLDTEEQTFESIAIQGERIAALGRDEQLRPLAGKQTRILDVGGRLVVPGLIDGHAHMDREGLKEALPSLAGCQSVDDVVERIAELAASTPVGEWIVTMPIGEPPFYEGVPDNLAEGRFPTRHELDRAAPELHRRQLGHRDITDDRRKHVVEIMRNTAGKNAQRFNFFRAHLFNS